VAGLVAIRVAVEEAPARVEAQVDWAELVATVHRQMRSIVGTGSDLEDLTQMALEQVLRSVDRHEGRAKLSTFTYQVCAHVALNHWRWWRRWLRRFDLGIDEGLDAPTNGSDGPDAALGGERVLRLHRALERLGPEKRLALTLADIEGLSAPEIAEIARCPEATVRSRLRQARIELTAILRRDPYFSGGER
jgi:RNA polymerase sigma-70 factor, ECF subfamily